MVLNLPTMAWVGITAFVCLLISLGLGIATNKGYNLLKMHKLFAGLTVLLTIIHFLMFFGIIG